MKIIKILLSLLIVTILVYIPVSAEQSENVYEDNADIANEYINEYYGDTLDNLMQAVPDDIEDEFYGGEIKNLDFNDITQMNFGEVIGYIWNSLIAELAKPIKALFYILIIVMAFGVIDSLKDTFSKNSLNTTFSTITVLCISAVIISPVSECIESIISVIEQSSNFMTAFVPTLAGVIMASGHPITASGYSAAVFALAQVISTIAANILVPLLGIHLAFTLVGTLNPNLKVLSIAKTIKTAVTFTLGFVSTIFVGVLTLQGVVGSSADTVTLKASKFVAGSFIPVVGGAVADAMSSVNSCMHLLKATIGTVGIVVLIAMFLTPVLQVVVWMIALSLASIFADMLGAEMIRDVLKACSSTLSLLLSITVCFILLLITSTTIVMTIGGVA